MRIGVVTFHCAYNFGSVLQTWALVQELKRRGHEVRAVDYRGADFDQYRLIRTDSMRELAASLVFLRKNLRRRDSFERFIRENLPCTSRYGAMDEKKMEELSGEFDCFVCGSDQIWNLDCTRGPVGPYFLSFAGAARRVAYAPSLSHTSFKEENFGPRQREMVADWLARFDAVSVREAATVPLFQPYVAKGMRVCLDPTLLLDADVYDSIVRLVPSAEGTLFVYMLEKNEEMVSWASSVAREMNVEISYVSRRKLDFGVPAKNYYGVGPAEFLGLLRGAAAVVTNSFHATVFSLLFDVPFQTFATERSGSRMRGLLESLGASDCLTDGSASAVPHAVSPEDAMPRLAALRSDSLAFLDEALAG